jgi:hypothetical protein
VEERQPVKKQTERDNQRKEDREGLSQVDVDEVAANRISESISEGYMNGDLEGF